MTKRTPSQIVTVTVAAHEWGVNRRTARRWIETGRVEAEKIAGGKTSAYVLTREEVDRIKAEVTAA